MCENVGIALLSREAHPSVVPRVFISVYYVGKIDWLSMKLNSVSSSPILGDSADITWPSFSNRHS